LVDEAAGLFDEPPMETWLNRSRNTSVIAAGILDTNFSRSLPRCTTNDWHWISVSSTMSFNSE
jgi:hypothetical protein